MECWCRPCVAACVLYRVNTYPTTVSWCAWCRCCKFTLCLCITYSRWTKCPRWISTWIAQATTWSTCRTAVRTVACTCRRCFLRTSCTIISIVNRTTTVTGRTYITCRTGSTSSVIISRRHSATSLATATCYASGRVSSCTSVIITCTYSSSSCAARSTCTTVISSRDHTTTLTAAACYRSCRISSSTIVPVSSRYIRATCLVCWTCICTTTTHRTSRACYIVRRNLVPSIWCYMECWCVPRTSCVTYCIAAYSATIWWRARLWRSKPTGRVRIKRTYWTKCSRWITTWITQWTTLLTTRLVVAICITSTARRCTCWTCHIIRCNIFTSHWCYVIRWCIPRTASIWYCIRRNRSTVAWCIFRRPCKPTGCLHITVARRTKCSRWITTWITQWTTCCTSWLICSITCYCIIRIVTTRAVWTHRSCLGCC